MGTPTSRVGRVAGLQLILKLGRSVLESILPEKDAEAILLLLSETVTAKEKPVAVVGVPLTVPAFGPLAAKLKPGGSEYPPVEIVYGGRPPAAVQVFV